MLKKCFFNLYLGLNPSKYTAYFIYQSLKRLCEKLDKFD